MINKYLNNIGLKSKKAFNSLSKANIKSRNKVLETYNKELLKNKKQIIKENAKDVKSCKRKDLIDRLLLSEQRIENINGWIDKIRYEYPPI